VPAGHVSH